MNQMRKVTTIVILAMVLSIVGLTMCIYSLRVMDNNSGVATVNVSTFKMEYKEVRDMRYSLNTALFSKEPVLRNDQVHFGVTLNNKGSYAQFYFTLCNLSTDDVLIDKIQIDGLGEYKDYVSITISGVNEGEVLKSNSEVNVKVVVVYDNLKVSEDGSHIISLNDIGIRFLYKE